MARADALRETRSNVGFDRILLFSEQLVQLFDELDQLLGPSPCSSSDTAPAFSGPASYTYCCCGCPETRANRLRHACLAPQVFFTHPCLGETAHAWNPPFRT